VLILCFPLLPQLEEAVVVMPILMDFRVVQAAVLD
jgi:hypothetical protein